MNFKVEKLINASPEAVWKVITDIDNAPNNISGIETVEILERQDSAFVGLKWRETRIMFGKEATEVMWITDARENTSYSTRAESHGSTYITHFELQPEGAQTRLVMTFDGQAQTFGAKLMSAIMGIFFKGATIKALEKDLSDIKAAVEG